MPEFVDIDEHTYNMSIRASCRNIWSSSCTRDATGQLISQRSGRPVSRDCSGASLRPDGRHGSDPGWPSRYSLIVIEDACQAHGAEYFSGKQNRWMKAGSMGQRRRLQLLSRQESGRLWRRRGHHDERRARGEGMKMLRDHGQAKKYYHDIEGYNGRLDSIQAGMLQREAGALGRAGTRSAATAPPNTIVCWRANDAVTSRMSHPGLAPFITCT